MAVDIGKAITSALWIAALVVVAKGVNTYLIRKFWPRAA